MIIFDCKTIEAVIDYLKAEFDIELNTEDKSYCYYGYEDGAMYESRTLVFLITPPVLFFENYWHREWKIKRILE